MRRNHDHIFHFDFQNSSFFAINIATDKEQTVQYIRIGSKKGDYLSDTPDRIAFGNQRCIPIGQ